MQNTISYRDVRVFFSKTGECKYIGHLDVNTVITRAIQKSHLPVWRTQGFNVHAYITFSNPLSLGFSSLCESFDIRITDDDFDIDKIPDLMNPNLPSGRRILKASLPKYKNSMITSALYEIHLHSDDIPDDVLYMKTKEMLESDEIITQKKTKKGMKDINLAEYLSVYDLELDQDVRLDIKLPSGGGVNINPSLFISKLEKDNDIEIYSDVKRVEMYVDNEVFR